MNRIEAARYLAAVNNDNVSVNDDARIESVPKGVFVHAWVFVSNEDIDTFLADGATNWGRDG